MKYIIAVLMGVTPCWMWTQDRPRIDSLVAKGKSMCLEQPEESLIYSYQARNLSMQEDYYWGKLNSSQWISEAYYALGQYDSTRKYDQIALDLSRDAGDTKEVAINLTAMAGKEKEQGNNALALDLFQEAELIMRTRQDTYDLVDLLIRKGGLYIDLDQLDSAMINCNEALMLARAGHLPAMQGYALGSMSIIVKKMGDLNKALEYINESIQIAKDQEDDWSVMANMNNAGVIYKELGQYENALAAYDSVDYYGEKTNWERAKMSTGINGGIVYNLMGNYPLAEAKFRQGVTIATKYEIPIPLADAKNGLARSLYRQGRFAEAKNEITEALELAQNAGSLEKQIDGHEVAAELYQALNDLDQTIYHLKQHQLLKDSIFQLEKAKQIDELNTQYATVKKDAEIKLLNKNAEIDATKRKALWASLLLAILAAVSIIYSLIQRRKKEKLRLTFEKEIEIEKREVAERELEFKKKELTAKVLQLARKNEFLQNLEDEISALKSSVDSKVSRTTDKISRMIHHDSLDDDEWEQFGKEFSSIHQDFFDRLTEEHGAFTKSEIRLLSLLKMNLSSKDIANTLRISAEGIKKARYRLRKKLNLDSEVDLQGYLIGY